MNKESNNLVIKAIEILDFLFPLVCKMDNVGRKGGYLCIADSTGNLATYSVGQVDKGTSTEVFARANVVSLRETFVSQKVYRSAVIDNKGLTFSFCGFYNQFDLAMSVAIASGVSNDRMPIERQKEIAKEEDNPHIEYLCELVDDMDLYLNKPLM